MHAFRHSFLLARHHLADVMTGPVALALIPMMMITWYVFGGGIVLLIISIGAPTLAVVAAQADRRQRHNLAATRIGRPVKGDEAFETALRSALYLGFLRHSSVMCLVIDLQLEMTGDSQTDPMTAGESSYQEALLIGACLRRRDQVFILGRSRFGVVTNAASDLAADDAITLATRLKSEVECKATEGGYPDLRTHFGVSISPRGSTMSAEEMIRAATEALITARESHAEDVQFRAPAVSQQTTKTSILERDIRPALESGDFRGWFQPQICARTGRVTGFETLARWIHPTEGLIPPAEFLPILERRGMLPLLRERMLGEALNGFEAWRGISDTPPTVGVNFAQEDLLDATLPDRIMWELDRRRIEPQFLCVEVLETVISQSTSDVTACTIQRLAEMGCRIDLDDFGTGHASISSLKNFSAHRLKIDRSFVQDVEKSQDQQNMIAAIVTMAKQLGLETLAEGVETQAQEICLARLGCDHLQGFSISRPMPLTDALQWLSIMEAEVKRDKQLGARTG